MPPGVAVKQSTLNNFFTPAGGGRQVCICSCLCLCLCARVYVCVQACVCVLRPQSCLLTLSFKSKALFVSLPQVFVYIERLSSEVKSSNAPEAKRIAGMHQGKIKAMEILIKGLIQEAVSRKSIQQCLNKRIC